MFPFTIETTAPAHGWKNTTWSLRAVVKIAGVDPSIMGYGPVPAVKKALARIGMKADDVDLWELNEAFAAQSLACLRELGLDGARVNVNGGAIALGHPLGATGAKLTVQLIDEMKRRQVQFGMVTMCIGGGMGAAATRV